MLVDGSGSLKRMKGVMYVQQTHKDIVLRLYNCCSKHLHECSLDWKLDFPVLEQMSSLQGFSRTEVFGGLFPTIREIVEAADGLDSVGGTPLWDSVYEKFG